MTFVTKTFGYYVRVGRRFFSFSVYCDCVLVIDRRKFNISGGVTHIPPETKKMLSDEIPGANSAPPVARSAAHERVRRAITRDAAYHGYREGACSFFARTRSSLPARARVPGRTSRFTGQPTHAGQVRCGRRRAGRDAPAEHRRARRRGSRARRRALRCDRATQPAADFRARLTSPLPPLDPPRRPTRRTTHARPSAPANVACT